MTALLSRLLRTGDFDRYLKNTYWLFAEQILRMIAGLFVAAYVARFLGPSRFGIYSYAIALAALFAGFAKLGLDGIMVRHLVNTPDDRERLMGAGFWSKLAATLIAVAGAISTSWLSSDDALTRTCVAIISTGLVFQALEVIDFYFQSAVESKYVSICRVAQLAISTIVKLALVAGDARLIWFAAATVVDQATLGISLLIAYRRKGRPGHVLFPYDATIARRLLGAASPLIVAGVMVSIYSNIDRLLLARLLDSKTVGYYAAAASLTSALYFIPTIITNSLFPAILNAKKQSASLYAARLSYLYKAMLLVGVIVCLLLSALSGPLVKLLYGEAFSPASGILRIYVWNFLFVSFSAVFGKWLLAEQLQRFSPRFTAFAMVTNVAACWHLIPLLGGLGAAVASLTAQAVPLAWYGLFNVQVRSQLRQALSLH